MSCQSLKRYHFWRIAQICSYVLLPLSPSTVTSSPLKLGSMHYKLMHNLSGHRSLSLPLKPPPFFYFELSHIATWALNLVFTPCALHFIVLCIWMIWSLLTQIPSYLYLILNNICTALDFYGFSDPWVSIENSVLGYFDDLFCEVSMSFPPAPFSIRSLGFFLLICSIHYILWIRILCPS